MTQNIQIRSIRPSDDARMAFVIRQVMTEFETVGEGYSINDPEVDALSAAYDNAGALFLVIEKDGEVMGGGGIAPLEGGAADVCELKKMYAMPALRGLGLGSQLIDRLIEAARQRGYRQCYLETVERMEAANRLYRRKGFERLSCRMGDTGHGGCEVYYRLEL